MSKSIYEKVRFHVGFGLWKHRDEETDEEIEEEITRQINEMSNCELLFYMSLED